MQLLTPKVDVWMINHNSQATSDEHTYSFVAKPDTHPCKQRQHVNKWSGEGTIQAEENADNVFPGIPVWRAASTGRFAITFEVGEFFGIIGEGTATVIDTKEYAHTDAYYPQAPEQRNQMDFHCTGHRQVTVPLIVVGSEEGSTLSLKIEDSSALGGGAEHTFPWACTGPGAKSLDPSSLAGGTLVSMMTGAWLEVPAEDGATAQLDVESSSPFMPGIKGRHVWSIQIKALQPEGEGSRPSDIPGPWGFPTVIEQF
jgi:hypothetical protein